MYTVTYFIKKFEAIPEEKWRISGWGSGDVHCAGGHCMSTNFSITPEFTGLVLVGKYLPLTRIKSYGLCLAFWFVAVNDGAAKEYQQPTPKQRILAALYDIKAMQEKEQKPERIKTVYVSVPETIRQQIKEPVLS